MAANKDRKLVKCGICHNLHSRHVCPVCGSFELGRRYYDRNNGLHVVRARNAWTEKLQRIASYRPADIRGAKIRRDTYLGD